MKLTEASDIRRFLTFIEGGGGPICCNISHHFQYLEFLYKIKKIHSPVSTSQSLLNKSIIIEYFAIIEAILDSLLRSLVVKSNKGVFQLEIQEYTSAKELFRLAKCYGIISPSIHTRIGKIQDIRNRIHIKRTKKGRKLEYQEYSDSMLKENENIFKDFLTFLFSKNNVNHNNFLWPWDVSSSS